MRPYHVWIPPEVWERIWNLGPALCKHVYDNLDPLADNPFPINAKAHYEGGMVLDIGEGLTVRYTVDEHLVTVTHLDER